MSQWTPEIADLGSGVHRVTLRLPWALDHVHCYAIEGADGWTIVDTGLGTPGTTHAWEKALGELGSPQIRQIVITHYHPDHIGASAALAELTGASVLEGTLDAELARGWGDHRDLESMERYFLHHGMPADMAAASASDEVGLLVHPAEPTHLVDEGDRIDLGGEPYEVLFLPGHADGHIALLGERSRKLFGGDVLLHDITPNVGRWSDTKHDPLGKYLDTLDRLVELDPTIVYPGHHRPIEDAAARATEIRDHHAVRLDEHHDALRSGASTAYEVSVVIWSDSLGFHERRFALVEAIAHLERLERLGRAEANAPGRWIAL